VQTEVEVWPENWDAVQLFTALGTQWRVSIGGGPSGLDYAALMALMPLYGGPSRDLLDRVRVMEAAVLTEIRKEKPDGS
jgi:hypothetical protein